MADPGGPGGPGGRFALRSAQLLLVAAAASLWAASRLPWVLIRSFDGLGQPRQVTVYGASWSTALLPMAVLSLAAAIAAAAVRGWALRVLAVLMAAASLAAGYLAIGMWVVADVAARAAAIAGVPVVSLLAGDRRYGGAVATLAGALGILAGAVLLMRSAVAGGVHDVSTTKYAAPWLRRSAIRRGTVQDAQNVSEQMIWDALDQGCDPTDDPTDGVPGSDAEGR